MDYIHQFQHLEFSKNAIIKLVYSLVHAFYLLLNFQIMELLAMMGYYLICTGQNLLYYVDSMKVIVVIYIYLNNFHFDYFEVYQELLVLSFYEDFIYIFLNISYLDALDKIKVSYLIYD